MMWDISATIFGWVIVLVLILTILFIAFMSVVAGLLGLLVGIFLSIYFAFPILVISSIGYGVSKYMQEEKKQLAFLFIQIFPEPLPG